MRKALKLHLQIGSPFRMDQRTFMQLLSHFAPFYSISGTYYNNLSKKRTIDLLLLCLNKLLQTIKNIIFQNTHYLFGKKGGWKCTERSLYATVTR